MSAAGCIGAEFCLSRITKSDGYGPASGLRPARRIDVCAVRTASASSRQRASSAQGVDGRLRRDGSSCLFYRAVTSTTTSVLNAEPPWAARWTTTPPSSTGPRRAHLSPIAVIRNRRKFRGRRSLTGGLPIRIARCHRLQSAPVSVTTDSSILIYGARLRAHAGPWHSSRRI